MCVCAVQEVSAESQVLMARALEEAEQEMRSRAELIQQIRAMESVPVVRTKFVDLTETGGQGLLAEMSVAEVRVRLAVGRRLHCNSLSLSLPAASGEAVSDEGGRGGGGGM